MSVIVERYTICKYYKGIIMNIPNDVQWWIIFMYFSFENTEEQSSNITNERFFGRI